MRKPCCDIKHTSRGAWTKEEDQKLIDYIQTHGEGCWRILPKEAGLHRCGKSCRLRWINYLRPDIKRGNFAEDEEDLIVKLHALLGNRWSLIAGRLPGRTDNEVKNYWNSHIRRKLINMGIDPNNHRLNQTIPHHENDQEKPHLSPGIKSSASAIAPSKPLENSADEQLSDAASDLDDEALSCRCDLNLDLTIAFPSLSPSIGEKKQDISTGELNNKSKEVEGERFSTPSYSDDDRS